MLNDEIKKKKLSWVNLSNPQLDYETEITL